MSEQDDGRLAGSSQHLSGAAGYAMRRKASRDDPRGVNANTRSFDEEQRISGLENHLMDPTERVRNSLKEADSSGLRVSKRPVRAESESEDKKRVEIAPRIMSRHIIRTGDDVYTVRWSPDSKYVAAASNDGEIVVHSAATGAVWGKCNTAEGDYTSLGMAFLGDSQKLLTANTGGVVTVWTVVNGKKVHQFKEENDIFCMDLNWKNQIYATAGKDCIVRVYDVNTHKEAFRLEPGEGKSAGHWNRIFSCRFHPEDPNILVSGGWDDTIQIWDTRTKGTTRSILGPHMVSDSVDIYGNTIVTGSYRLEDQLQTWDLGTGKLICELQWHQGAQLTANPEPIMAYSVRFSNGTGPAGGQVIAAGGQGTNEVKIFRSDDQRVVARLGQATKTTYSLEFSPTNEFIAVGSSAPALHIIDLSQMYAKTSGLYINEAAIVPDAPPEKPKLYQTKITSSRSVDKSAGKAETSAAAPSPPLVEGTEEGADTNPYPDA